MRCVGCGYCCRKAPCAVAQRIHGPGIVDLYVKKEGYCPSLTWDAEKKRYFCKPCADPILGARYREELAAGAGCCSSMNSDRRNIPPPPQVEAPYKLSRETRELLRAMGREFMSSDKLSLIIWSCADHLCEPRFEKAAWAVLRDNRPAFIEKFMG